jgi:hypothetical protein
MDARSTDHRTASSTPWHPKLVAIVSDLAESPKLEVILLRKIREIMTSVEGRIYGSSSFHVEIRATRSLLKFHDDHKTIHGNLVHVRECLRALEAGEKSNAVDAFKQVWRGKESLGDVWPDAVFPHEDADYVWGVSEALFVRWCQLMNHLSNGGAG